MYIYIYMYIYICIYILYILYILYIYILYIRYILYIIYIILCYIFDYKSFLFYGNEAWKKKDADTTFDVTMGSYDGAELCELIGIYIKSLLKESQTISIY